jgi:hypothetical protein
VVQQASKEGEIPNPAHFDEKLDRIESLLKRLIENGVSSASGATPSATTLNQSSASEKHATSIAKGASIERNSPVDDFSANVIVTRRLLYYVR